MSHPPALTDAALRARNLARASDAFLQELAADDLQDRLSMINKDFQAAAVVTPFPDLWAARLPEATILEEAETLTLEPEGHDLVIHAMGLHWANDPVGQLIQCRRALRPDGLFLAASLGGQTLAELRACLAEAETRISGGLSPRVAPMGEIRDLGALLQRAGFALPVADSTSHEVAYRDLWHLMRDLKANGESNALASRRRVPLRKGVLNEAARLYAAHHAMPDGRLRATFEIVALTGWAPHASQPKPLRPGSAKTRLAEAIGTKEHPLRN